MPNREAVRIEELWVLPGSDQVEFATKTGATVWFADLIPPDEAIGRRLAACWNACVGIPTETLEAGVVVVPVEEYRYLVGTLEEYDEVESQMGNCSKTRSEMLRRANARLQQNGGESRD